MPSALERPHPAALEKDRVGEGLRELYLTAEGKNTNNWPGYYTFEFAWLTRAPKWDEYVVS